MPRIKRRTPTGRTRISWRRERNAPARCANCGRILHGVPIKSAFHISRMSKTSKRPSRAYGGYYCGNCTRELFKERARMI